MAPENGSAEIVERKEVELLGSVRRSRLRDCRPEQVGERRRQVRLTVQQRALLDVITTVIVGQWRSHREERR